jgi:hypothetical protein
MSEDNDFEPPWKHGGFGAAVEIYGTSILKRRVVDHVLPDDWQSGEGHGRKVLHVVAHYLDTAERPDDEARLRDARRAVARELDVDEKTIKRAIGERLYGDDVYEGPLRGRRFLKDLQEIEALWKEHLDDAPDRVTS